MPPEPNLCPLSPAPLRVLQAAAERGTTNNQALATHLGCAEETVKANFRRIAEVLGTTSRCEALLRALREGWVEMI